MSYDNWLDAPYNVDSPDCADCGIEISGEVFVDTDDNGNEYPYCETCYNANIPKVYTFAVTIELSIVGSGCNEEEALRNALDELDIVEVGELRDSEVIEWEYE